MKAKVLTAALAAVALTSVTAAAQSPAYSEEYAYDNPFWGLRASLDVSCPGKWKFGSDNKIKIFGPGAGVALGAVYNHPFGGGLYVEPGVSFFYDTMDADFDTSDSDTPVGSLDRIDAWVGTWGMRVPVMVGYRIDFTPTTALFLSTGPQLEVGFTAHLTDDMPGGSSLAGELYDTLFRRFDCQWKIGAGVAFGSNYYIGVDAAFGLVNLSKHSNATSFHRNLVTFSVGYNF
ncbi:MAG: PorT family protein [Muribaculaceae bacterium]|jgi:hypothetical protein|nr:PorT family protein [Muribaculaceae bacterium]